MVRPYFYSQITQNKHKNVLLINSGSSSSSPSPSPSSNSTSRSIINNPGILPSLWELSMSRCSAARARFTLCAALCVFRSCSLCCSRWLRAAYADRSPRRAERDGQRQRRRQTTARDAALLWACLELWQSFTVGCSMRRVAGALRSV